MKTNKNSVRLSPSQKHPCKLNRHEVEIVLMVILLFVRYLELTFRMKQNIIGKPWPHKEGSASLPRHLRIGRHLFQSTKNLLCLCVLECCIGRVLRSFFQNRFNPLIACTYISPSFRDVFFACSYTYTYSSDLNVRLTRVFLERRPFENFQAPLTRTRILEKHSLDKYKGFFCLVIWDITLNFM